MAAYEPSHAIPWKIRDATGAEEHNVPHAVYEVFEKGATLAQQSSSGFWIRNSMDRAK